MSTGLPDPKLKFPAGRFEDSLLSLIIALQLSIAAMILVVGFFWGNFVVDSYSSREGLTFYPEILALAFGMTASVYLLNRLYETE